MVPARNLRRRHYDNYGCWFTDDASLEKQALRSDDPMADERAKGGGGDDEDEGESHTEVGTSSKGQSDDWLQLGIGLSPSTTGGASSSARVRELDLFSHRPVPLATTPMPASSSSLLLSRMPPPSTGDVVVPAMTMFQPPPLSYRPWGFWGAPHMVATGMPAPPPPPPLQYSFRRLGTGEGSVVAGGSDVRVVSPPRLPQAGVWFVLQAAQNQAKEPLPQIPKSYLRIKDGRMTVRLLMKYLVNKLGLDDESEAKFDAEEWQGGGAQEKNMGRDKVSRPTAPSLPDSATCSGQYMVSRRSIGAAFRITGCRSCNDPTVWEK